MIQNQSVYPPLPVTLEGETVTLKPLTMDHADGLKEVVKDGELWKLWYTMIPSPAEMEKWLTRALAEQNEKTSLPFTVFSKADDRIIGCTRYMRMEQKYPRVEIGSTWYAASVQRTQVNTECKYLLLSHAFEALNCVAVEFRTHRMNVRSRAAIERLGAQLDGILRNHLSMPNGTMRDTAVYSILNTEWPMVKTNLEFKLGKS